VVGVISVHGGSVSVGACRSWAGVVVVRGGSSLDVVGGHRWTWAQQCLSDVGRSRWCCMGGLRHSLFVVGSSLSMEGRCGCVGGRCGVWGGRCSSWEGVVVSAGGHRPWVGGRRVWGRRCASVGVIIVCGCRIVISGHQVIIRSWGRCLWDLWSGGGVHAASWLLCAYSGGGAGVMSIRGPEGRRRHGTLRWTVTVRLVATIYIM
jgi:hypothetical protein